MKKLLTLTITIILTAALFTATAYGAQTVKSIEQKSGPEVVAITEVDEDGNPVEDGDTIDPSDILVTPLVAKETASEETKQNLEEAYGEVLEAEVLSELTEKIKDIVPEGYTEDQLVVTNIVNIEIVGPLAEEFKDGEKMIKIKMSSDDIPLAIMVYDPEMYLQGFETWNMLETQYWYYEDGYLYITMSKFPMVFAFIGLTDKPGGETPSDNTEPNNPEGGGSATPRSPQTGEGDLPAAAAVVLVLLGSGMMIKGIRKRDN